MRSFDLRRARLAATATMLLTLAACSDGTGPAAANLDPQAVQQQMTAFRGAFQAPPLTSFGVMSGYISFGSSTATAAISASRDLAALDGALTPARARATVEGVARRLMAAHAARSGLAAPTAQVIPSEVLGTTFVFDQAQQQYVASNRTGAPTNGVRFVLYAIDPVTGDPTGSETGYVEIVDNDPASPDAIGLRVRVVSGSTVHLDYTIGASSTSSSASVDLGGFLTDGTTRVDFGVEIDLGVSGQQLTLDAAFAFDIPSRQFTVVGVVEGSASSSGSSMTFDMAVQSGSTTIQYVITETDGETLNVAISVNGQPFATITGSPANPTVTGAGGRQLTDSERETLADLLDLFEDVLDGIDELLSPIGGVGGPA